MSTSQTDAKLAVKKELPEGFQRAEFLLEKGQIDRIVGRDAMRDEIARLVAYATGGDPVAAMTAPATETAGNGANEKAPKKKKKAKSEGGKNGEARAKSRKAKK